MLGLSRLPPIQAFAIGAHPHGSPRCLRDGGNHMIGKAGYRAEILLPQDVEAAGLRADPKIALSVSKDGQDAAGAEVRLELWSAAGFVLQKETLVGADPEITA